MLLISWIVRILAILFLIRLALRFVAGVNRPAAAPRTSRTPATREGGHLVRDPNCGTYVPVGRALQSGSGDAAVYFCSDTCRQAWASRKAG
jgi:uncharacterized protein